MFLQEFCADFHLAKPLVSRNGIPSPHQHTLGFSIFGCKVHQDRSWYPQANSSTARTVSFAVQDIEFRVLYSGVRCSLSAVSWTVSSLKDKPDLMLKFQTDQQHHKLYLNTGKPIMLELLIMISFYKSWERPGSFPSSCCMSTGIGVVEPSPRKPIVWTLTLEPQQLCYWSWTPKA